MYNMVYIVESHVWFNAVKFTLIYVILALASKTKIFAVTIQLWDMLQKYIVCTVIHIIHHYKALHINFKIVQTVCLCGICHSSSVMVKSQFGSRELKCFKSNYSEPQVGLEYVNHIIYH